MTARITKLLVWLNPTSVGEGPRWDVEVVRGRGKDAKHERMIRAKEKDVVKLVREAMR